MTDKIRPRIVDPVTVAILREFQAQRGCSMSKATEELVLLGTDPAQLGPAELWCKMIVDEIRVKRGLAPLYRQYTDGQRAAT